MRRHTFLPLAVLCVLAASSGLVAQSPLTPFRGLIDHVSVDQSGGAYSNVEIWHRAISGDGRYVVHEFAKLESGERRLRCQQSRKNA
jgi:hypothetical protein